jgi:nonribosomal peptide synthetase protein VioO
MSTHAWAQTPVIRGAAHGHPVVDDFLAAAGAHPDRVALVDGEVELSYAHLVAQVLAVAHRLGPCPGVVGVQATHRPATIAGLFGAWVAGGAYCPVDPSFPVARRDTMLAAAGCAALLDPAGPDVTPLAGDPDDADELAYTLFTSGSTGAPKPVLTPRAAIGAVVRSLRPLFGLTADDRVLQFASLNWDTCFEEILPALTTGAALVFDDDAYSGSFPRFLRMVARQRITVLDLPSAYWHELVTYLSDSDIALPPCVRLVIIGGEAVSAARLADWCRLRTGHARLLNTYGATETTLITHAAELAGPLASQRLWRATDRVPIGLPLPHVVEETSVGGELLIGGLAVATGYRDLPQATAARFVTVAGERFFATGDRVERLPDGSLAVAGRIDNEVKIRGVRVDPAEVEAHIAAHPSVGAVAVTAVRVADHAALAAYVVARPTGQGAGLAAPGDGAGLAASIVAYLRDRVPAHLIPSRITVVADLVYTPSGKVDRNRLEEALR